MAFNKYFQDELAFLHELGAEFAHHHPKLTRFLSERSTDPDVARLLEGFAFLTGRLRQKVEDELPELTHSLIQLLWPHYLRPVPALTMMEFRPIPHAITEMQRLPRGVELSSEPVDETRCQFQTCFDVELYPLIVKGVESHRTGVASEVRIPIELCGTASLDKLNMDKLRLHFHGEIHISQILYLWTRRYLKNIRVEITPPPNEDGSPNTADPMKWFDLDPENVKPVGFAENEALLPYPPNAFPGYRFIQEYFNLPEKFLFVDIFGFKKLGNYVGQKFTVVLQYERPFGPEVRVRDKHIRLHCTPAVNLFKQDADPIRMDQKRVEYRVRPGGKDPSHYEIYSVDGVEGWLPGSGDRKPYASFESFEHVIERASKREEVYFRARVKPSVTNRGMDHYVSFVTAGEESVLPKTETISLDLTCTNRNLPEQLSPGDINIATGESPPFTEFSNITAPTRTVSPPLDGGLQWLLISNMSLNYMSLTNAEALRVVLKAYDFHSFYDRQAERAGQQRLEGIKSIEAKPIDVLDRGLPIRGLKTRIEMAESMFASEGDMYLFASVLSEFFGLYASMNSFHELEVLGLENGEIYNWPARTGFQPMI